MYLFDVNLSMNVLFVCIFVCFLCIFLLCIFVYNIIIIIKFLNKMKSLKKYSMFFCFIIYIHFNCNSKKRRLVFSFCLHLFLIYANLAKENENNNLTYL